MEPVGQSDVQAAAILPREFERDFRIKSDIASALQSEERKSGGATFTRLYAAFVILLYRYSANGKVEIGIPAADDFSPKAECRVGVAFETLLHCLDLSGRTSVEELLGRVQRVVLEADDHQDLLSDQIIDEMTGGSSYRDFPFSAATFVFEGERPAILSRFDSGASVPDMSPRKVPSDLLLRVGPVGDEIRGSFQCWGKSIDSAFVERLIEQYVGLVVSMVKNPHQAVNDLPMMSDEERQLVLHTWNDTDVTFEPDGCLHELIKEQAVTNGSRVAVECGDESLTYQELQEQAERLAYHLSTLGVGPDILVGISLERSLEMVVGLLGILLSGGGYVPINPSLPANMRSFILADSGVDVLITRNGLSDTGMDCRNCVYVDRPSEWNVPSRVPNSDTGEPAGPGNLAYLIYTSGSTGRPKGVMVNHESVFNRLLWMQSAYPLSAQDRVLQKTPISFDISAWEVFWPLMFGARLVLAQPGGERDPDYLAEVIETRGITVLHFVPSMLEAFLDAGSAAQCRSLKRVFCGGEAIGVELMNRFFEVFSCELHNLYGPTEAAIDVSSWACQPDPALRRVPIGRPIANTRLYILDSRLQPVSVGMAGELHIGGVQVARGYLNRPDLTNTQFFPNPFGRGRLYKTGDRARFRSDGNIEFLGRLDDQFKIRGIRIEPGEIEEAVRRNPAVREAAVVARVLPTGNRQLVAYITLLKAESPDHSVPPTLRHDLRSILPEYMVPSIFVVLDRFPISSHGKLNRAALPEPEITSHRGGSESSPRPGFEQTLADIWSDLLGITSLDRKTSLLEIGGDSISILQLVSAARTKGILISASIVFEEQTIERIALRASATTTAMDDIEAPTDDLVPLTPIQHWFFERHPEAPNHFNQSAIVAIPQRVDTATLRLAIKLIVERHHAFRLRFEQSADEWEQRLSGSSAQSVGQVLEASLAGLSHEREREVLTLTERELQTGLDLRSGPLMQVALIDHGPEQFQDVMFVVHHLAIDWVSWRVLIADLLTACRQITKDGPALGAVPCTFRSWARELLALSKSECLATEAAFWQGLIKRNPGAIPTDYPHEPGSTAVEHIDTIEVTFDANLTRALFEDVLRGSQSQVTEVFLFALASAWRTVTGLDRLFLELEGHGRESNCLDLARTVGWCTSLYPVLIELEQSDIRAGLESVKDQLRRIPNRGVGYGLLRYLNPATRDALKAAAAPEVCFNYAGRFAKREIRLQAPDMAPTVQLPHILTIEGALFADELHFQWGFSRRLHRKATIQALSAAFTQTLRELVVHFQGTNTHDVIDEFPLVSLSHPQISRLVQEHGDIENMYSLTPVQAGILFQCLIAPNSGIYYVQTSIRLCGSLNTDRLEKAFRAVIERHTALRTSLALEHLPHPVQIVHRANWCLWRNIDWRDRTFEEQLSAYDALLQDGRDRSAQFSENSLFAGTIVRVRDEEYILLVQAHHVLLDGWSSAIVLDELFDLYVAPQTALPPARPFGEAIAWKSNQDSATACQLWTELLRGLQLPTRFGQREFDRSGLTRHRTYRHELSVNLWHRVRAFARANGLTTNTIVQAAHALLLSHYSSENDVVFGVTESGRSSDFVGAEQMVGLLINTLPCRVKIMAEARILPWLQELQIANARLREDGGGASLIEIRQATDVPAGVPLFDSVLVFENYATARHAPQPPPGVAITTISTDERNHYPLTVVAETGENLSLSLSYWEEVLDCGQVEKMAHQFDVLLESMTTEPDQTVSAISNLSEPRQPSSSRARHHARLTDPQPLPIHEEFEKCAACDPDNVALICGEEKLTYGELNQRANRVAHHLRSEGASAGSLIGICLPRTADLIVAIIAVLKAGAAYVPLDPEYPALRLGYMLENSETKIVLSHSALRDLLPASTAHVIWMDSEQAFSGFSVDNLNIPVRPDALAYVIYTSGSTGQPKGVQVTHHNVRRLFTATEDVFGFDSTDIWTMFHSASFDFSVWEVWGALLYGGRLIVVGSDTSRSPADFLALLIRERVSVLNQTPSAFLELMAAEARQQDANLLDLRFVIFGGEKLVASNLRPWFERARKRPPRMVNMYGITETTVHVTFREISYDDALQPAKTSLIGQPLPDLRVFVLDENRRPVPPGVTGEIYVAGAGLARGYLGRPEITSERFLDHEAMPELVGQKAFSRFYRTGDLARILPDGDLEFLGRCDEQVKVRGFRIELGEVESVLAAQDLVRSAVVVATRDGLERTELIAFVVPCDEESNPEEVVDALRTGKKNAAVLYASGSHLRGRPVPPHNEWQDR